MDHAELELTAELAAIRLKEGDIERLGSAVDQMLRYFEVMSQVDVTGLEPTTHAHVQANRLRPDTSATDANPANDVATGNPAAIPISDAMLDQAADLEGRLIVIPNVL